MFLTYRGVIEKGTVVFDGPKPVDGTVVDITPVEDVATAPADLPPSFEQFEAFGMWRDRDEFGGKDSAQIAQELRERVMRRDDGTIAG